ncbi:hypothetical protein ABTA67_20290, partial [Acinetobacter baumannii]
MKILAKPDLPSKSPPIIKPGDIFAQARSVTVNAPQDPAERCVPLPGQAVQGTTLLEADLHLPPTPGQAAS